jgi:hypothetical protein
MNSILLLSLEVLCNVVDYNHLLKVSPYLAQILDENGIISSCVLSVKSVRYPTFRVELVEHPVRIILHRCCKNNHFKVLAHKFQKLSCSWSDQEGASEFFIIRHSCLVGS